MFKLRSPGWMVVAAAYACAALAAAVILVALSMPNIGVSFVPQGRRIAVQMDGRSMALLAVDTPVEISSSVGVFRAPAGELVQDFVPPGDASTISAWYGERDRLAAIGKAQATLSYGTGAARQNLPLHAHPRRLSDLSADVWMLLVQGGVIGLLGVWIAVVRPRDAGAQFFGISCLGVLMAAFSGAVFDARELTADGRLLQVMMGFNFVGCNLAAAALTAVFLQQPFRLVRPAAVFALLAVAVVAGVFNGLGWTPLVAFYAGLVLLTAFYPAILVVQWIKARGDPAARAVLRWVGATALLGTGGLTIAMAAPQLFGLSSLGGDGMSLFPLFATYGGIAFGVGGHRLFDLDRWSHRLMLGGLGALALLACDALLIGGLGLGGRTAFALSLLVVGYLYFPARFLLWRWIAGRPALSDSELFQFATEVAFAADPGERRNKWRQLLTRLFDPLDITPLEDGPPSPIGQADGAELVLPATVGETALILRYRAKGRRLFDSGQVRLARELVDLMHRAEQTRDEYTRGVLEERQRIARDLHDDVSARLLTSLHRDDVAQVRSDVRKAMGDIRTIVSSLTGEKFALDQVMADLRYETRERLGVAKIGLVWPLPEAPFESRLLEYSTYKGLISSHREIVSNILQHAEASQVVVSVQAASDILRMTVEDDGKGLGVTAKSGRAGNGLRNINHRLGQLRGSCVLQPGARGTRVEVTIPLNATG